MYLLFLSKFSWIICLPVLSSPKEVNVKFEMCFKLSGFILTKVFCVSPLISDKLFNSKAISAPYFLWNASIISFLSFIFGKKDTFSKKDSLAPKFAKALWCSSDNVVSCKGCGTPLFKRLKRLSSAFQGCIIVGIVVPLVVLLVSLLFIVSVTCIIPFLLLSVTWFAENLLEFNLLVTALACRFCCSFTISSALLSTVVSEVFSKICP